MTAARIAYSPTEVAEMIGASEDFVRDLCIDGELEGAVKLRAKWFIPVEAVENMFRGREQ